MILPSEENRITVFNFQERKRVCINAFGVQTDIQCLGYDCLCPLAQVLYEDNSYQAVDNARRAVYESLYCKSFQNGWDGRDFDGGSRIGFEDGCALRAAFGPFTKFTYSEIVAR